MFVFVNLTHVWVILLCMLLCTTQKECPGENNIVYFSCIKVWCWYFVFQSNRRQSIRTLTANLWDIWSDKDFKDWQWMSLCCCVILTVSFNIRKHLTVPQKPMIIPVYSQWSQKQIKANKVGDLQLSSCSSKQWGKKKSGMTHLSHKNYKTNILGSKIT